MRGLGGGMRQAKQAEVMPEEPRGRELKYQPEGGADGPEGSWPPSG